MQRNGSLRRQWGMERVAASSAVSAGEVTFEEWVAARGQSLLRFAYLVTGDPIAAEDAVQEGLVSACARWPRIRTADDPEAYVRRMIANAHISWWRRVIRRESPVAEVRSDQPTVDPDSAETQAVWELCATLPRRQRAAVVLRFYEGLTYAEIGRILDCGEATVRSQVHRALAALRARLESEGDGDA
ncbi:MAG TPA: SigE family RNA polymerase sigma factor [Nocardioidaceae bacterium]|nr:SigE family RNA polymerase sigma factor [Nocardioidaceae bacterium]